MLTACLVLYISNPPTPPLHPPISTPAGCLTQLPDHPHPKTKMNKFSPAGSGITHGATARLESNTLVFSSHLLARRIQQIYGSFQLGINVTHGLRDMAYILGPLSYSIKNRKREKQNKSQEWFLSHNLISGSPKSGARSSKKITTASFSEHEKNP